VSLLLLPLFCASTAQAQGPAPETAPPLFPGGGLVPYNSVFTTWGLYRDFDLTVLVPIVTNHFDTVGTPGVGGTGLGDAMFLVKYRFYRRDSERGTTQASVTFGPKIPTGRTDLTDVI
jgi:hypothetical protein